MLLHRTGKAAVLVYTFAMPYGCVLQQRRPGQSGSGAHQPRQQRRFLTLLLRRICRPGDTSTIPHVQHLARWAGDTHGFSLPLLLCSTCPICAQLECLGLNWPNAGAEEDGRRPAAVSQKVSSRACCRIIPSRHRCRPCLSAARQQTSTRWVGMGGTWNSSNVDS